MSTRNHGNPAPRGLDNVAPPGLVSYDGRFGRLFGDLPPAHDPTSPEDDAAMRAIAETMHDTDQTPSSDNPAIPAGYTYLGQFVDHDLTFDPTSVLQRRNDVKGLINFRTPRFDLDNVYGSGPQDEPFQYDKERHEGLGLILDDRGSGGFDMPRNGQQVALIGDPRNDENGIVSQLHVAFMSLHNALLDQTASEHPELTGQDRFDAAQRQAQWHYQWVVAHDFLPRIIGLELHGRLLTVEDTPDGPREAVHLRYYRHKRHPFLPVEFSVAAYRYGHSQVRNRYSINGSFNRPIFDPSGDDFRGFQPLRPGWHASWPFFFEMDEQAPQLSRAIDGLLSPVLFQLEGAAASDDADLALRNLRRGMALQLPSGQAVARKLGEDPLGDADLAQAPAGTAPLWYYVLKEAAVRHSGQHLGPVGGRIVGEVLLGLLQADPQSYLSVQPTWQPTLPARGAGPRSFNMADLLTVAVPQQCRRF